MIEEIKMSKDSYNERAARGQAYNLAVHDAVQTGKADDQYYVAARFIYYYELGVFFQDTDIEQLLIITQKEKELRVIDNIINEKAD